MFPGLPQEGDMRDGDSDTFFVDAVVDEEKDLGRMMYRMISGNSVQCLLNCGEITASVLRDVDHIFWPPCGVWCSWYLIGFVPK